MTTGAIRVLPVLGKFFPDGQVLRAIIFIQGRYIVGRRRWRIIEDDLDNPGAAGDGMGAPGAGGHAEHRGAGDHSSIAWILRRHALEGSRAQLVADLIIEPALGILLGLAQVMVLGNPLQGDLCFLDRPAQLIPLLFLLRRERLLEILVGNLEMGAGVRGGDLFRGQGAVINP